MTLLTTLSLSAQILGIALNCGGSMSLASAASIHEKNVLEHVNTTTIQDVETEINRLLRSGLFPQDDFHYFVDPRGRLKPDPTIKLIHINDAQDPGLEISELSYWLSKENALGYLFGSDTRGDELHEPYLSMAKDAAERIRDLFFELYPSAGRRALTTPRRP